jgi:thiol-disulfide isomerase/thioredoxin
LNIKMTLVEISSADELKAFIQKNTVCVVTFSAHWCGPCKQSKPQLEELAKTSPVPISIVHESDIGDYLHTFKVTAFPSYVLFVNETEVQRIKGVNLQGVQDMIEAHADKAGPAIPESGGNTLGGSHSAAEARALRLAKLEANAPKAAAAATTSTEKAEDDDGNKATPMETEESKPAAATASDGGKTEDDTKMEDAATDDEDKNNPVDDLDKEALKTLTESMGFSLLRAQKGLLFSTGGTVESAVEWLMEHQDDADIDEDIPEGSLGSARSYKCNDCGKILSNMANLELHANKTGHSDFEESTCIVVPLTPEEKAAKILEIKSLLASKRAEREEAEKVDQTEQEKRRRFMGKEMVKTKEVMEREARKREATARKREKTEIKRERDRIRAELAKDKMERIANKGKLLGKLGVDGYAPSAIQYNTTGGKDDGDEEEPAAQRPKTAGSTASAANIDDYITKVSSYRAGGDGGKSLKILKILVGNAADNPDEDKYKKINMETNAYKNKVKIQ